ncbi:MAG: hypothetical protein JWL65_7175 [Gammaproteobacteria bacterium]|nr:hypothetical protein [Gammaproteobacteria bacterium]
MKPRHFEGTGAAAFVLKALECIGDHARNFARRVLTIQLQRIARVRAADPGNSYTYFWNG